MLGRATEREQHNATRPVVDELPADLRRHPDQLALAELGRLGLDYQRQPAFEHEVHLLLAKVAVDPAALPGVEHDLVHPERRHSELPAQRQEAISEVAVKAGSGGAVLHVRATSSQAAVAGYGADVRATCRSRPRPA